VSEFEPQPEPIIVIPTLDDVPSYRAMHAQSWRDTYPNEAAGVSREWVEVRTAKWLTPDALADSKERVKKVLEDTAHQSLFVAKVGDVSVGMVHVSSFETGQMLEAIYVDKAHKGTGLGQKLLNEGLSHLDLTKPIELEVASYNEHAQGFYHKNGFEIVPGSEHLFAETMPVITMIRPGDTQ